MKHIVSGIQPTGSINLGTYLGSIKNFVRLQKEYSEHHFFLFIADLHAITVPQERMILKRTIRELAALYLACGLSKERLSLFIQSEISAHSEMAHLLQCFAYVGELERMTQFKEKAQRQEKGVTAALFTYPVLMAGDVLLYDAEFVPVGDDQQQHLELARDIAVRINNRFGELFQVPKALIPKVGARVMSLTNPDKKMSKSDSNPKSKILLLDSDEIIRKKIMSSVTDSDQLIRYDKEDKPGISNLLTILSAITDESIMSLEKKYQNASYQVFKNDVADCIIKELKPIKEAYNTIITSQELDTFLDEGKLFAEKIARKKIAKFHKKLGLGRN